MPSLPIASFSPSELAYLYSSLSLRPPIRPDARSPTSFRSLIGETDLLASANGSARLCFADGTEGIVGVKAEVERTGSENLPSSPGAPEIGPGNGHRNASGSTDWISVTIDLPGQHDDDAMVIPLSKMIHEGLVRDATLIERLRLNHNWHWKLYIDILLLSSPTSYPLPLLSLSTHLALISTRLPCLVSQGDEDPLFNDDWQAATNLYARSNSRLGTDRPRYSPKPPISLIISSVGSNVFFDPSREELAVADAVLVLTIASASEDEVKVVAIRSIDSPAIVTTSSGPVGEERATYTPENSESVWKPKRGGVKTEVIRNVIDMISKPGGVGAEILAVLDAFV